MKYHFPSSQKKITLPSKQDSFVELFCRSTSASFKTVVQNSVTQKGSHEQSQW